MYVGSKQTSKTVAYHYYIYIYIIIISVSCKEVLDLHTKVGHHREIREISVSYVFTGKSVDRMCYQSVAVVVAQLSADGPVSMFFYLLLIREHNSLVEPGELQFHTGSLLQ